MEDENETIKILLLGNYDVGKTGLIKRYLENTFDEENNNIASGSKFSRKVINKNGKEYELQIWDTAGQEKFHAVSKHFYKDAYIICLVYDITNQESLDSLKLIWYPDVKKYGEKYVILAVVGNQCHLYDYDYLADENKAKEFAQSIGAIFKLTSPKTGEGVEELFDTLVNKFLSSEFQSKYLEMKKSKGDIKVLKPNEGGNKKKKKGPCKNF